MTRELETGVIRICTFIKTETCIFSPWITNVDVAALILLLGFLDSMLKQFTVVTLR